MGPIIATLALPFIVLAALWGTLIVGAFSMFQQPSMLVSFFFAMIVDIWKNVAGIKR